MLGPRLGTYNTNYDCTHNRSQQEHLQHPAYFLVVLEALSLLLTTVLMLIKASSKPEFSVRIVVCDHYLTKPTPGIDVIYSDFRGTDIKQVPILRIFGPAVDGQKACLHVHGVFPYFYIPCPIPNPEPQFLYQIAASLDKALNIALKQATASNQHVYKISLVKGLPFYGYHDKDHLFLKIFLYNPGLIKQAVELCINAAILGQTFQPHESHLNFTLQFFIDFNLFGMSNIDLQTVWFRKSLTSQNSNDLLVESQYNLKPESICYYEADCLASHIINRQRIGRGDGIENPGLEEVWEQEQERRKQLNMSVVSKSLSQGRLNFKQTESHYKYQQTMLMKMSGVIDKPVKVEEDIKDVNKVHYPAETIDGSQFYNAVDVSVHLPEHDLSMRKELDETLTEEFDNTFVDENAALNCNLSLHYSQVLLDSEDLDLVDMLQNMDDTTVEEDSIIRTPAEVEKSDNAGSDSDDAEYSQIFNEDTLILVPCKSTADVESLSSWNGSFWDGANIPQLDGTCDDDHVKKVRKKKMRPFKLGLSRPNSKNKHLNVLFRSDEENKNAMQLDPNMSTLNLNENVQNKSDESVIEDSMNNDYSHIASYSEDTNESVSDIVHKLFRKEVNKLKASESYDLHNHFEPRAGPSALNDVDRALTLDKKASFNKSFEFSPEEKELGIVSFYNKSNIFDASIDNQEISAKDNNPEDLKAINYKNVEFVDVSRKNNLDDTAFICLTSKIKPPTYKYILSNLHKFYIPKTRNIEPYFSNHYDVGEKLEIGQMVLKLQSKATKDQKQFEKVLDTTSLEEWRQLMFLQKCEMSEDSVKPENLIHVLAGNRQCILEPLQKPPTYNEILKWLDLKQNAGHDKGNSNNHEEIKVVKTEEMDNSQAIGLIDDQINSSISLESNDKDKTSIKKSLQVSMQPDGSFLCFGDSGRQIESFLHDEPVAEAYSLTVMLLEVHTSTRGELHPDPSIDTIQAIFVTVKNDSHATDYLQKSITEILVIDDSNSSKLLDKCVFNIKITYVKDENQILDKLLELLKKYDPDIMCGYEIEMNSWGYVLERAQALGLEIVREISRITDKNRQKKFRHEDNNLEGKIIGRIVFNVWRLFRHELALSSYSFENCMAAVLKERVPKYSYAQLSKWWNHESRILRWITVEYYMTKLSGTVRMLDKLDIINRTSELARLFGLQWWEVLSRGSQFRVESLMLRATRPLNLIALSPTVKQRAAMRAPECLPLIFEPESRFYSDPVIVLDFQSLYPSLMIAYNYCFSTCIGRVQNITGDTAFEFGAWRLRVPKSKLEALINNELVNWSPVGVGFVKPSVRRGVLPALLRRILAARQAVKKSMKMQTDEAVKKAMHSRQMGLKLIANVTYGYTAANFSGRMPCMEVGDSVVAKGRETLERAIKLVRDNTQWNAKVIYGDTDSMFVLVPGGTRAEAFVIGQQIADAVTADNPSPVALKLEKVYQPCILQTKKRYVGYMYESIYQKTPMYEAKGIETVRRDGCPAGVKLLQRSLCELFDSGDMSRVKGVVVETLSRLARDSLPLHELFFTREYHGPTGYRPGAAAPPNEIAKRILSRDRRAGPRSGERVPWLVCAGAPSEPLVRLAREPREVLAEKARAHTSYYAARVLLPPLHRCLSLLGVNVFKWWKELGYSREVQQTSTTGGGIARYLWRERCAMCGARGTRALCGACAERPQVPAILLAGRLSHAYRDIQNCTLICNSCCGHGESDSCENTECPVLWRRLNARQKLGQIRNVISHLPAQFSKQTLEF